jgi:hypothetical protein
MEGALNAPSLQCKGGAVRLRSSAEAERRALDEDDCGEGLCLAPPTRNWSRVFLTFR